MARGWCRKANGEQGVWAPGSRGTERAGEGDQETSAALDFSGLELSQHHSFICTGKHPHTTRGLRPVNNAREWDKDRSGKTVAQSTGEQQSLKTKQQQDKWT